MWSEDAMRTGPVAICRLLVVGVLLGALVSAQEGVDQPDARKAAAAALGKMTLRVRVTKAVPEQKAVHVAWRRGGEGLGGQVIRGEFAAEDKGPDLAPGTWSAPLPLETVVGKARGWEFPTLMVSAPAVGKKKAEPLREVVVEIEFADGGKVFKTITEPAPKGSSVGFAFPGGVLGEKGSASPGFADQLRGLSGHARARRERLEKAVGEPDALPRQFAVIGHLAGYGEGSGYGIRHCNPDILKDECRTLRLLGMNGLVGEKSVQLADAGGVGQDLRRIYWGGPGAGSPMNFFKKADDPAGCPFDPALKKSMATRVQAAIEEHRRAGAKESWALWWDEIGVAVKEHVHDCPRCREAFRDYLRRQGTRPADFGKVTWDDVSPYPLWQPTENKGKAAVKLAPGPKDAADALRYYYTFRFMTFATGQLFPESAAELKKAGIRLYAMQGPTPSWDGSSLDWHEFYDTGANTAVVWETSNRDPRAWQWESYLGDIARGIAARHDLPIGCLIKPHRGAPEQRMLSVVSRGATVLEWYTYGPDYAKGDSFSQSAELLERVARAGRFLGRAEEYLYGSRRALPAEVAFVSPRSSEIWGKAGELGITAFEDAKWVYLALAHAHIPVDILSEQQLAEGKLGQYKAIYVVGPNLRRDALAKVKDWVNAGGILWTDALGLSRDEANQACDPFGLGERKLESWGSVEGYRAVTFKPLTEMAVPTGATFSWNKGTIQAAIGRVPLPAGVGECVAKFADGKPAVTRRKVGKGTVMVAGLWAGLTYSARVRRADFDMGADFDPTLRALIAAPALDAGVSPPVVPSQPLVESVLLEKAGKRCVALMNWGYRHAGELQVADNLRVTLPGLREGQTVRSLVHGKLTVEGDGATRSVVLPKLAEIDLLILE
jgi:hypothetical protein